MPSATATATTNSPTTTAAGDPKPAEAKAAGAGCAFPESNEIVAAFTIKKGCSVEVKSSVTVKSGGVLTIEPGAKLTFVSNGYLEVQDGQLIAKGEKDAPIVFTSGNRTQAVGDWTGIYIGGDVVAGTILDYVDIQYAGQATNSGRGAVTIVDQKSAKRISINHTHFANNDQSAVWNDSHKGAFASFSGNSFKGNKISLDGEAMVLASVAADNKFEDPLRTTGTIDADAAWPNFGAPVFVHDALKIEGENGAPTLAIAPGNVLKFASNSYISIGEGNGGALNAARVTFTSANATPHAGDWIGIFVYQRTSAVGLEGATIQYAGQESSGGRAAITFYDIEAKKARNVKLTGAILQDFSTAAFSSTDHDCGDLAKGAKITGTACRPE